MLPGEERVLVLGHSGLAGAAFMRAFAAAGATTLVGANSADCDLRDPQAVSGLFEVVRPSLVVVAAGRVGGIEANRTRPAEFTYDNLMILANSVHACHVHGARRAVVLGSSCMYPRICPQPMREEYLMSGPLEPTNEGYAISKLAGIKLAQMYGRQYGLSVLCPLPCNLYGPGDSFDPESSHVLAALVRKFCDAVDGGAPEVVLWGTGEARREFLHVDDMVAACLLLADNWQRSDVVNVGCGTDVSIKELADMVAEAVGFRGEVYWDSSKPDGMPRKCLDVTHLNAMGFVPQTALDEGVGEMVRDYRQRYRSCGAVSPEVSS